MSRTERGAKQVKEEQCLRFNTDTGSTSTYVPYMEYNSKAQKQSKHMLQPNNQHVKRVSPTFQILKLKNDMSHRKHVGKKWIQRQRSVSESLGPEEDRLRETSMSGPIKGILIIIAMLMLIQGGNLIFQSVFDSPIFSWESMRNSQPNEMETIFSYCHNVE
ncbi:unnamed protein product [Owenia fusiformis]|uniref:Uncharacterized protein n=1 Tax=Owenia fusiformis TaxID=6347 RepID=A0A8S4PD70_OWEFU|nr:unnamed protein product [Owenia fusiformis]